MKKLLYLFLALPFFALTGCHSDDDYPDVTIHMEYDGAQIVDGVYYIVQGEPFAITELTAIPNRKGAKATITSVAYVFDGEFIGRNLEYPFYQEFDTSVMTPGPHILGLQMAIAEEGCTPIMGYLDLKLMIVPNVEDIPSNGAPETSSAIDLNPSYQN